MSFLELKNHTCKITVREFCMYMYANFRVSIGCLHCEKIIMGVMHLGNRKFSFRLKDGQTDSFLML